MLRRSPIRRKPRRDPVTQETAIAIFQRDGGCHTPSGALFTGPEFDQEPAA